MLFWPWKVRSFVGLVVGALFFAVSLTPSLLPRDFTVQGVLSGCALAAGYGIGVFLAWLWTFLELPTPTIRVKQITKRIVGVLVGLIAIGFLWRAADWQNSIRSRMEMESVETAYPWRVAIIALVVGLILILAARGLRAAWLYVHHRVGRVVPRRVSYVLTSLIVVVVVFMIANHVVARMALNVAEGVFLQLDKATDEDVEQPVDPMECGSSKSLVPWDSIGRRGKNFIKQGPTQEDIAKFWGERVGRPLRVYVGVRTAESPEQRAKFALEELKRVGGFERSILVVATPTGTGWLDPAAVDSLEYLHKGDTAIVAAQYSYLPSWITLLIDPQRAQIAAQYLFNEVYDHWRKLPRETRPRLYVHGLSLGALGSEASADLFTVFEDPIQGGLWSGPPFPSAVWSHITRSRNPDSPVWLPTFRDGSMVRFMGRESTLEARARWGPMRFIYIQHPSDPMTFFSPDIAFHRPQWLIGERGPDVSPYLRWFPIVTFLQTAFDLPMATNVPHGYGHNFDAGSYIDAWIAVTAPKGVNADDVTRLKRLFIEKSQESQALGSE
jgi:uncharacterized membrane protein